METEKRTPYEIQQEKDKKNITLLGILVTISFLVFTAAIVSWIYDEEKRRYKFREYVTNYSVFGHETLSFNGICLTVRKLSSDRRIITYRLDRHLNIEEIDVELGGRPFKRYTLEDNKLFIQSYQKKVNDYLRHIKEEKERLAKKSL